MNASLAAGIFHFAGPAMLTMDDKLDLVEECSKLAMRSVRLRRGWISLPGRQATRLTVRGTITGQ